MATGWMIGVLLELEDSVAATRHYFAVAQPDRARAEWAAADRAMLIGSIAASPSKGMEPVEAVAAIPAGILGRFGLAGGQVKSLGPRWPRQWISLADGEQEVDPKTRKA